jgi:TonB family protein
MNDASADSPALELAGPKPRSESWSQKKWLAVVAIIFAAHVTFIFAFGERKQIVPLPVTNVPNLKLADSSSELLALDDPTLFALPHLEGFAGPAWLEPPRVQFHRQDWTEQPRWLPLSAENLGAVFNQFMQTNYFAGYQLDFKPSPKLSEPVLPVEPALAQNSTLQIVGGLAQRRLLNEINPPSLLDNDVIAPSKVQALVDAAGNVVSVVLLESSGLDAADSHALKIARAARFAPAKNLTVGQMIFNWRTIPMTTTNDNPNAH